MTRAVLLVDHGSRRSEANTLLEQVAGRVRDARPDWIVEVAHLEIAPPSIAEGIARCAARGAQEIVVHPYFLAPGRHTTEDIPRLVREAAEAYPQIPVRVSRPLGLHPKLVDVILDRVEDAR